MVCKLGILNRVGLQKLPEIFRDYRTWQDWNSTLTYDEKKHLAAFTPEILKGREIQCETWNYTTGDLQKRATNDKVNLFKILCDKSLGAQEKAGAYRELLRQYGMALEVSEVVDGKRVWTPVEGRVRAVGVWDTVGSLGMPRMPFFHYQSSRSDDEARFADCYVDPNIDYAFHALALDEWRTSFGPTLWFLGEDNNNTQLRQVWFPGNHGNVGGGWPDQQIATISLAWMADQLTSLGVEFSRPEMNRLFKWVNPGVEVREWGMGKIYNPKGLTTWPDYLCMPCRTIPPRKPGMYTPDENTRKNHHRSMEFVHPCVRFRYQYNGKGLDDDGQWSCRALTENGYISKKQNVLIQKRPSQESCATTPFRSLLGNIIPYYEGSNNPDADLPSPRVRTHHPYNDELMVIREANTRLAWQTKENQYELLEEYVGLWERMFMKINEDLLQQQMTVQRQTNFNNWSRVDTNILTWLGGDKTENSLLQAPW
ncbi:hypothetical protein Aspvir_009639 [Aspergillus viridinutans]|uniref:T6SS Phospholipase effector Tle1-like catalytic domain-containing protein n=1 Tax=Aspergillus viridinutans TaxID=75553 RepID=A0A9P3C5G1_ASPVI|nr:uncharacterized protein Aspvir_009639 [Aspergillus viridinutans]GIK05526.1 hypothetical protein Aspvir_009639 [Aspergillus viridinutans]